MTRSKVGMLVMTAGCSMTSLTHAAIVSVTGSTNWLGSPPATCVSTGLMGGLAYAWNEKQNVALSLSADMVNNPGSSLGPVFGTINGVYDSHFIHYEDYSGLPPAQGTVTFNNPIVAVIFKNQLLDLSDAPAGSPTTIYPTGFAFRGLFTAPSSFITILGNTLTFNLNTISPVNNVAQVRVITQAPTPGSTALLGLASVTLVRRRRR